VLEYCSDIFGNFFGRTIVESEKKRKRYFGANDYPPTCKKMVLEDKTVIPYWNKLPNELRVNFTVGGNHGGGKFRMKSISRLYQIASVEHSNDETEILKATVLQPIGDGLREIVSGKRFVVRNFPKVINRAQRFIFLTMLLIPQLFAMYLVLLLLLAILNFTFRSSVGKICLVHGAVGAPNTYQPGIHFLPHITATRKKIVGQ
jgi:hypothetical protein